MTRPKYPPTPASSTDLTGIERKTSVDNSFILPPPAINQKSSPVHHTPPGSPTQTVPIKLRCKRTSSGDLKMNDPSSHNLPAPPSRPRKIIQMKPKTISLQLSSASDGVHDTTRSNTYKKKQPSSTSAAGRKIARKTAHSIIERRRRSKMNEEFGVLKDMIPACDGVEMHKLAILQAGIEYVRYLEGCIAQLKQGYSENTTQQSSNESIQERYGQRNNREQSAPEETEHISSPYLTTAPVVDRYIGRVSSSDSSTQADVEQKMVSLPGVESFTTSQASFSAQSALAAPSSSLLSPAFNAIHFSPDLLRNKTQISSSTNLNNEHDFPALPQSAATTFKSRSSTDLGDEGAEATATVALLMMTTDRRGLKNGDQAASKRMSVKDLLDS